MRKTFTLLLSVLAGGAYAQDPAVIATLDSNVIRLGEQVVLDLEAFYGGGGTSVTWPELGDTLTAQVEVVRDSGIDTAEARDGLLVQRRHLTITAWDSGFWAVPPFRFVIAGDTLETAPLLLEVRTVAVDTTQAFRDIKEVYEARTSLLDLLAEYWPWLAGGLLACALVIAIVVLVRRRMRRPPAKRATPPVPLHEAMLLRLEELEKARSWQHGAVKTHYVALSEILRAYVEARFGVPALERTTDELVHALRVTALPAEQREQLANVLRLADLVKFAKLSPAPAENEASVPAARRFIVDTTLADAAAPSHAETR